MATVDAEKNYDPTIVNPHYRQHYTIADVQAHDTFDNCWVTFFGRVYD
jgi:hypothetical protein